MINFRKCVAILIYALFCSSVTFGANKPVVKHKGVKVAYMQIVIPVKFLPVNYNTFSPDSCVLSLNTYCYKTIDSVTKKNILYYYDNGARVTIKGSDVNAAEVKLLFNSLKEKGNFAGLRFYYFDPRKNVNRYIDVNYEAKKLKEVKMISEEDRTFETLLYSQNEQLYARTFSKLNGKKYLGNEASAIMKKWFLIDQSFEKTGQFFYYASGNLKAKLKYKNGQIDDTLTVFEKLGKIFKQYIYKDGIKVKTLIEPPLAYNDDLAKHKKALLIGINTYATPASFTEKQVNSKYIEAYNIAGSINDVNLLKQKLVLNKGFNEANVKLLTDEKASREGILNALNNFVATLGQADIAFLHFSALSFHAEKEGADEVFILTSDYYKSSADGNHPYWITKKEIKQLFDAIKKKIGSKGQLVVSYDACGQSADNESQNDTTANQIKYRGETGSLLFTSNKYANVPFVVLSGTSGDELSQEAIRDGATYGVYSYALANAFDLPYALTNEDLISEIKSKITNQTPSCYANFPQFIFEQNQVSTAVQGFSLPDIAPKGNAHIISVGISNYPKTAKLSFENCRADAESYNAYFTDQYTALTGTGKVNSYLLTDSLATKKNILDAINKAMLSKPEDYFVFNFSGYTVPLRDSLGKQLTYFVPYGLKNLTDTAEIKKNGISLIQLKELLQMIPANNQLFITEAGSTVNFQKEFIKSLIESSPTLASLSNKNRVFIVPKGAGIDNMVCNYQNIKHGPLNYYITNLTDDLSIYGLFENEAYVNALKYALGKVETDCDYLKSGYLDIFFERNFINDLQFFMPNQVGQMRGVRVLNETKQKLISANSKRYAMVIGTNTYKGKPQWGNLNNPVIDAKAIADELETNYDYNVIRLLDQPLDSIYNKILSLSRQLKESDQLIIFVAGHGDFDADLLDDGLIVMNDSKTSKEDPFRNSYIQYSKLSRMINKLPANQILLIMDVCFGGTFDDRVKREVGRSETSVYDDLNATAYIEGKLNKKTRLFITSGGKREVPDGYAGQHSPFAQRLIMLLQDRGGSANLLTATNLHQSVEKLPSGPLIGGFGDNVLGSEFLLIPKPKKETAKPVLNAAKD